jgi:uncharacterized membrane protein HdeD (DUF308 family)
MTTATLIYLFAAFLLLDGIVMMVMGLVNLNHFGRAALMILLGLLQLGVGVFLFRNPEVAFGTLILILGFSLIVRGLFSFAHAFTNGKDSTTMRTMNGILGVIGLIVGVIVLMQPVAGGIAFVWILGLYALIAGPVMIAMSSDMAKASK